MDLPFNTGYFWWGNSVIISWKLKKVDVAHVPSKFMKRKQTSISILQTSISETKPRTPGQNIVIISCINIINMTLFPREMPYSSWCPHAPFPPHAYFHYYVKSFLFTLKAPLFICLQKAVVLCFSGKTFICQTQWNAEKYRGYELLKSWMFRCVQWHPVVCDFIYFQYVVVIIVSFMLLLIHRRWEDSCQ